MPYKVAFVSLGCAKNLVNTEQMMALCRRAGYDVTGETEGAADPSAAIEEFLRKKWRGTLPDDPRELKKASDALARRGYSWSDIVEGLRRYGAEAESDE